MAHGVAGGSALLLLAAAFVVGLALPGGGAVAALVPQGQDGTNGFVLPPMELERECLLNNLQHGGRLLQCASLDEDGVRGCCDVLRFVGRFPDDCACGVAKFITGDRGFNLDKICEATDIGQKCQDKAKEEARRAEEKHS